jgi:peroxiredoxin Q/BCP
MLEVGNAFPDFRLPDQNNQTLSLQDFAGKWLIAYIYPKDDTPGCTIEGRAFNQVLGEFESLNARVLGISADSVSSHREFCDKYDLTLPLLSDVDAVLLSALDVGQSEFKGSLYWNRVTYLVDPMGVIRKVWPNVEPQDHEQEILRALRDFSGEQSSAA